MLRRERVEAGDSRWGTTPFRIGLWVGSSVSPNSFEEAERQITESRGSERVLGGVLQLPVCPWCGSRLSSGERGDQPAAAAGAGVLLGPRGGLRVLAAELSRRGTAGAHRGRGDLPADSRPGDRHGGQAGAAAVEGVDRNPVRARGHRVHAARVAEPGFLVFLRAGRASGAGGPAARRDPAGDAAAAAGPDHPGRAAPDQRRPRLDGGPVRDRDRPAELAWPDPARARRLDRDRAAGARPGGAGVRARA